MKQPHMKQPQRSYPRRIVRARNITAVILTDQMTGKRFLHSYTAGQPLRYEYVEFWQDNDEVLDARLAGRERQDIGGFVRAA